MYIYIYITMTVITISLIIISTIISSIINHSNMAASLTLVSFTRLLPIGEPPWSCRMPTLALIIY